MAALDLATEVVGVVVFIGGPAAYWMVAIRRAGHHERAVLKEHARASRAHYAAVEAAEDNPTFSPDTIERSVTQVVALAEALWRAEAPEALEGRPDADLIRAWARSCQSYLGEGLEAVGKPSVDLLGVVNRDGQEEDRVVLRVRVRTYCNHPRVDVHEAHHAHLDERWTFGRSGSRWVLLSVDGDPLAGPVLTAPLIPTPSADTERLREESLAELANAQKVGDDVVLTDLVRADAPPALALLDLSLVDSRFMPALIAAALAHLVEAWEWAVTGSEEPLEELASADARRALLPLGRSAGLVVRDAVLKSWEPTRLSLSRQPPAIDVRLKVEAIRFVAMDHRRGVAGNRGRPTLMTLGWVLELTDSARVPWRLATSNVPAEAEPDLR